MTPTCPDPGCREQNDRVPPSFHSNLSEAREINGFLHREMPRPIRRFSPDGIALSGYNAFRASRQIETKHAAWTRMHCADGNSAPLSVLHTVRRCYTSQKCHQSSCRSPRFSWHIITGKGSGPPRGVFQSFSHCFDSRDAAAGMVAPGEHSFIDIKDAVTAVRAVAPCGRGGCPMGVDWPSTGRDLDQPNHVCVCFGAEDFGE